MSKQLEKEIVEETHKGVEDTHSDQSEQEVSHEVTLFAEPIAHFGHFTLTNALFSGFVVVAIIMILAFVLRSKLKEVPGKLQNIFEMIIDAALGMFDQVTNDRTLTLRIFPMAITVFFFVLINNWFGILPLGGFGLIEEGEHGLAFIPIIRGGTADINTTLALAVVAVFGANIFGVFSVGLWKTFNKYVNLKVLGEIFTKIRRDPTIIFVAPITFFVGLIEIVGEFAKIASLSFRLFGNVFAGEVLLASMAAMMAYIVPIPFLFLEILVGVIQALIFSILLVVYFTILASDHDHDENEHEEPEHEKINKESIIINSNTA